MADVTIRVDDTPIHVTLVGAQGPRGEASGPLTDGSVTSAEISNDPAEQQAIAEKIGAVTALPAMRVDATSGNTLFGSLGGSLNDNAAGAHDGDANTGFGFNVMPNATSAYACAALGYGALNGVTTGHSNTAIGYQAGLGVTTGIMNTLVGVDAGYQSTALNYCVVVGHHCLNQGNFAGSGAVVIGQQTARYLTAGDNLIAIGRNAMANSPATGSTLSEVIGGASAIAATVVRSTVVGGDILTNSGATVTDSVLMGYRNHYAATSVTSTLSFGTYGFFRGSATGVTSDGNTGVGVEHGFQVSGDNNVFIGYRAGYQSADTSVSGSVCIGPFAGFNDLASNELVIANTDGAANVLIRGNFVTGDVTIGNQLNADGPVRCGSYTVATVPSAATAGVGAQVYVSNEVGGAVLAFSDGTSWRRVTDRTAIAA